MTVPDETQQAVQVIGDVSMSSTIAKLADALAKAQSQIRTASKDRTNPHFKSDYATLASILNACREPLAVNGLSIVQAPTSEGPRVTITTMLLHSSGEWIASPLTMTARDASPQSIGSAITYARKYALASVAGVAPDDDDDGEGAQEPRGDWRQRQDYQRPPQQDSPRSSNGGQRAPSAKVDAPDGREPGSDDGPDEAEAMSIRILEAADEKALALLVQPLADCVKRFPAAANALRRTYGVKKKELAHA